MTKTMTFAAVHFSVAFSVAYVMTGSAVIGGAIALVEPAVNTIAYFFHEKAWQSFQSPANALMNHDILKVSV